MLFKLMIAFNVVLGLVNLLFWIGNGKALNLIVGIIGLMWAVFAILFEKEGN